MLDEATSALDAESEQAVQEALSKLQKEGDLSSRRSLNRLTRLVTLFWAIVQSIGVGLYLRPILFNWNVELLLNIVLGLTTGAMIVFWLSEIVTDYGLGNGSSLLVFSNIISSFPNLCKTFIIENLDKLTIPSIIIITFLIICSLYGIVLLQEAIRRIPIISLRQLNLNKSPNIVITFILKLKYKTTNTTQTLNCWRIKSNYPSLRNLR